MEPSAKKPTLEKFNPPLLHLVSNVCFRCHLQDFSVISAHTWEQHYSVHFLRNVKTWITGLTLAPEDYGSRATLQPIHRSQCLRSGSHWDCRMSENKRWKVVQQTSSLCVRYICSQHLTSETHYQTLCDCLSVSGVLDNSLCGCCGGLRPWLLVEMIT